MAVILLFVFPMLVIMGCCVVAWLLGTLLTKDAETRYEGSELLDVGT